MKRGNSLRVLMEKGLLSDELKALLDSYFAFEWGWMDTFPDMAKVNHIFSGHVTIASRFMRGGGMENIKKVQIPSRNGKVFLIEALKQAYMQPYLVVALYSMTNMLKNGSSTMTGLRWEKSFPSEVFVFHLDESKNVEGEQIL